MKWRLQITLREDIWESSQCLKIIKKKSYFATLFECFSNIVVRSCLFLWIISRSLWSLWLSYVASFLSFLSSYSLWGVVSGSSRNSNLLPWEITVQTRETKVSERWSHQIFYVMKSWGFFPEPSNLSESERDEFNTQIVTEVTSKDLVSFVQLSNFPIFSLLWKETFWVIFDHCKKYFLIKI